MQPHVTVVGILLLAVFLVFTRMLIVYRTVKTIKSHMIQLVQWRNEAIQKGICGVHYEEAHRILYGIQKYKLEVVKRSFFGSIIAHVLGNKWYEVASQR